MKGIIQIISISVVMLALVGQPAMGDNIENHEFLYGYLAGHYIVIGKELNSDKTYYGKVVFSYEKGRLRVTRDIQGKILKGEGRIEHTLGSDETNVLRVRFARAGQEYEITYLWRSDLDNYARLSGYLYQSGKQTNSPGLEALFRDQPKR
jgi:hypothetical protein